MTQPKKNLGGRPTKYREEYNKKIIEYFSTFETFELMGKVYPKIKTIEGFCSRIEISKKAFYEWVKKYPKFRNAWEEARVKLADQLFDMISNRIIDPNYGKLLTVNCTDMENKTTQEVHHNVKSIQAEIVDELDKIEKENDRQAAK